MIVDDPLSKIFAEVSDRITGGKKNTLFSMLINNEFCGAIRKTCRWMVTNDYDVTDSELIHLAEMVAAARQRMPLINDGKQHFLNDHLPEELVNDRLWRLQGEHHIMSMRLAKPQIGPGEPFIASIIPDAYLTNAGGNVGDVIYDGGILELKTSSTNHIKDHHLEKYIKHNVHILSISSVSVSFGAQQAKRTRYKMFAAKDYLDHMYVAGDSVKFNSF